VQPWQCQGFDLACQALGPQNDGGVSSTLPQPPSRGEREKDVVSRCPFDVSDAKVVSLKSKNI
jgi:hypothetical protein